MQNQRLPEDSVLKELEYRLKDDFTYASGRIIGSMCTIPHPLARKVYTRYLEKNIGDSGLFPAVDKLENETVTLIGELLSNPAASGHIVTGGTEANTLALWAARKLSKKKNGEVVVPASVHCSFDKAADMLGLKIIKVRLNNRFQVDIDAVKDALNPKTIAIVGIAGTTGLGVVDPIDRLSEIASENSIYLHVDAAFGGFVLPFLKELGHSVPDFDFSLSGVRSITVDPHKMGLAPIPSGGILFRDERLRKTLAFKISYLAGGETEQSTLAGTRSGASVIAVWTLMRHFGRDGYRETVKNCLQLTFDLAERIRKIHGLDVVREPTMNVIGIKSRELDIHRIALELRLKKWAISLFPHHIRVVIMPHVKRQHIDRFLQDLQSIVDKIKS
ncbi:tyrosine decarboxylase MfnA [Candidatus Bathyarchaeota archaeon]|nr:tyrosine decarboxylase MfnA [Candidatus Bathyarchaeota archaeon]